MTTLITTHKHSTPLLPSQLMKTLHFSNKMGKKKLTFF